MGSIKRLITVIILSLLPFGSYTYAFNLPTANLTITLTVAPQCIVSTTPLNFGSYTLATLTGTATISVVCTNTTPYAVSLDKGTTAGGTISTRLMNRSGGGGTLQYNLYQNAAYTTLWGDGTTGGSTVSATGTGLTQAYTVYGRVPASQASLTGSYSDTVTVTVTF